MKEFEKQKKKHEVCVSPLHELWTSNPSLVHVVHIHVEACKYMYCGVEHVCDAPTYTHMYNVRVAASCVGNTDQYSATFILKLHVHNLYYGESNCKDGSR